MAHKGLSNPATSTGIVYNLAIAEMQVLPPLVLRKSSICMSCRLRCIAIAFPSGSLGSSAPWAPHYRLLALLRLLLLRRFLRLLRHLGLLKFLVLWYVRTTCRAREECQCVPKACAEGKLASKGSRDYSEGKSLASRYDTRYSTLYRVSSTLLHLVESTSKGRQHGC